MATKPPLGIMPRNIWEIKIKEERYDNILKAIERYKEVRMTIPYEWLEECYQLAVELGIFNEGRE